MSPVLKSVGRRCDGRIQHRFPVAHQLQEKRFLAIESGVSRCQQIANQGGPGTRAAGNEDGLNHIRIRSRFNDQRMPTFNPPCLRY